MSVFNFKAKTVNSNRWVFGNLLYKNGVYYIVVDFDVEGNLGAGSDLYALEWYAVKTSTISQVINLAELEIKESEKENENN